MRNCTNCVLKKDPENCPHPDKKPESGRCDSGRWVEAKDKPAVRTYKKQDIARTLNDNDKKIKSISKAETKERRKSDHNLIKMTTDGFSDTEIAEALGFKSAKVVNNRRWKIYNALTNRDAPNMRKIELARMYVAIEPATLELDRILKIGKLGDLSDKDFRRYKQIFNIILKGSERISKTAGLEQINPDSDAALAIFAQLNVFIGNVQQAKDNNKIPGVINDPLKLNNAEEIDAEDAS